MSAPATPAHYPSDELARGAVDLYLRGRDLDALKAPLGKDLAVGAVRHQGLQRRRDGPVKTALRDRQSVWRGGVRRADELERPTALLDLIVRDGCIGESELRPTAGHGQVGLSLGREDQLMHRRLAGFRALSA